MRILHVNKFLHRRGGAEAYMEDLACLQAATGHDVEFFGMQHPDNVPHRFEHLFPRLVELDPPPPSLPAQARAACRILWSTSAARGIAEVVDAYRPDVVHLHNVYHQLSPSLLRPLARRRIPAVMTLHDYKLACPTYRFLDRRGVCEACVQGSVLEAVRRRCKDGSLRASALGAFEAWAHAAIGAYDPVARFVCPSRFMAAKMTEAGVFPDRLRWVPHFVEAVSIRPRAGAGAGVAFAGRLSAEKGVDTLIEAAGRARARLEIAGEGPEAPRLRALAAARAPGLVRFHGRIAAAAVHDLFRRAAVVAVPSRWYENQPMVVLEAFACATPVVSTRLGGLTELVQEGRTGHLVAPDDPDALALALVRVLGDPAGAARMGAAARRTAETDFSPGAHLSRLDSVYLEAVASVARDG